MYEWSSLCDKEGITIEDALPVIQLSRVRKDKRIYGVLGDPKRGTNNKGRIIVNSVGEGEHPLLVSGREVSEFWITFHPPLLEQSPLDHKVVPRWWNRGICLFLPQDHTLSEHPDHWKNP